MTYWTFDDDLAALILLGYAALEHSAHNADRKSKAEAYAAHRLRGEDVSAANALANGYHPEAAPADLVRQMEELDAMPPDVRGHKPKRGDRFIHARYLKPEATPPYDSDDDYEVRVVTKVTDTDIYHAPEGGGKSPVYSSYWDAGIEAWGKQTVRRWL